MSALAADGHFERYVGHGTFMCAFAMFTMCNRTRLYPPNSSSTFKLALSYICLQELVEPIDNANDLKVGQTW